MRSLRQLAGAEAAAERWCRPWRLDPAASELLLVLAATETAAVEGISAAGATPAARLQTAAADAELLLQGPAGGRPHSLPPLPAGVSPALISQVVVAELGLEPLVVDLGCAVAPAVPHLRLAGQRRAANCLSTGGAMAAERVEALLLQGSLWGERLARAGRPLLIAECVPGGTTSAQALLTGLGLEVVGLVSGSMPGSVHGLKAELVRRGLRAAALQPGRAPDPRAVVAALGDPMQPLTAALVVAAASAGLPVLLAGGSQMAAVLALALALAPPGRCQTIAARVAVGTTAWVADEPTSDLGRLLRRIGDQWGVELLGFAADLHFGPACHPALRDYERGFVKEGVGAGGLALLWQLSGRSPAALEQACDRACRILLAGT
ncbi:MAG: TIGR00303 family protein [Cyanobium sp.]